MIAEYLESLSGESDEKMQKEIMPSGLTFYDSAFSVECLKNLAPLQAKEIEILLCIQGRMEIRLAERRMQFVGPGDVLILTQTSQTPELFFPTGQFQCKLLRTTDQLESLFQRMTADFLGSSLCLKTLQDLWAAHAGCMVLRDASWSSALQTSLAQLPPEKQNGYLLLVWMERFYFLSQRENRSENGPSQERYYDQYQRDAVQAVHDYMLTHMEESLTIQELARKFQMSPTFLKSCFRQLYGQPIHTYLQQQRLQQAAHLLSTTKDSVMQIAATIGYAGTSRFGVAFKERYQMTPMQYRRMHENRMSETEQILSKKEGKRQNDMLKY